MLQCFQPYPPVGAQSFVVSPQQRLVNKTCPRPTSAHTRDDTSNLVHMQCVPVRHAKIPNTSYSLLSGAKSGCQSLLSDTKMKLRHARTWPFVAVKAVSRCPRHSSKTGIGIVAREDLCAGRGGSPIPPLDRKRLQGDVATAARGVIHHLPACRSQISFDKDAPVARGPASLADGLEWIARLLRSKRVHPEALGLRL